MSTEQPPVSEDRSPILSDWSIPELVWVFQALVELLALKNLSKRHRQAISIANDAIWAELDQRPWDTQGLEIFIPPSF